jgi:hypothetical protein
MIQLIAFNPLDFMDNSGIVSLDPKEVSAIVSARTGDGHDYTSVQEGQKVYWVKQTAQEVTDMVNEALCQP